MLVHRLAILDERTRTQSGAALRIRKLVFFVTAIELTIISYTFHTRILVRKLLLILDYRKKREEQKVDKKKVRIRENNVDL